MDTFFSTPSPVQSVAEEAADVCESWGDYFPVHFSKKNITRKMNSLIMVFPNFIRQQNICYKMLKLEQEGERLHHVLKMIEKKYLNVKNKPLRYFYLIKDYENMLKCDMSIFDVPNKVGYIYYMICSHKNNIPHLFFYWLPQKNLPSEL